MKTVDCPTCQRPVPWHEDSRHRPFCSERCRLIDFGEWTGGGYRIPAGPAPSAEEEDERETLQ